MSEALVSPGGPQVTRGKFLQGAVSDNPPPVCDLVQGHIDQGHIVQGINVQELSLGAHRHGITCHSC
jgi:hypothetical protein